MFTQTLCCAELMLSFQEALQFPWLTSATGCPISMRFQKPPLFFCPIMQIILIKAQTCSCLGCWFPVALICWHTLRYLENCCNMVLGPTPESLA